MNILPGRPTARGFQIAGHGVINSAAKHLASATHCGIRPEHIRVVDGDGHGVGAGDGDSRSDGGIDGGDGRDGDVGDRDSHGDGCDVDGRGAGQSGSRGGDGRNGDGDPHCRGRVEIYEYLGADSLLYVNCAAAGVLTARLPGNRTHRPGQEVGLRFDESAVHLFDPAGRALA